MVGRDFKELFPSSSIPQYIALSDIVSLSDVPDDEACIIMISETEILNDGDSIDTELLKSIFKANPEHKLLVDIMSVESIISWINKSNNVVCGIPELKSLILTNSSGELTRLPDRSFKNYCRGVASLDISGLYNLQYIGSDFLATVNPDAFVDRR